MDFTNSGSTQSSSGRKEEYDSRGESISSLLNLSAHFNSISDQQSTVFSNYQPNLFSPRPQNLDAFPNPQSQANSSAYPQCTNDFVWSQGLRSDPYHGNFRNVTSLPSSASAYLSSSMTSSSPSTWEVQGFKQTQFPSSSSLRLQSTMSLPLHKDDSGGPTIAKNPRKRTRSSRRAPTTVLTTDPTNFRQMVQEFTGIPSDPSSGSPLSRRLDLFSSRSPNWDSLGLLYPSGPPSAQEVDFSQLLTQGFSSSSLNATLLGAFVSRTNTLTSGTTDNPSSTTNPDLGVMPKHPQNVLNMQNYQTLDFQQPLLQSSLPPFLRNPMSDSGIRSQAGGTSVHSLDGSGSSHENVNTSISGFQDQERADAVQLSKIFKDRGMER